jgi:hypothetical protein
MAEERVPVDRHLGVEGDDVPARRDDQRVDLDQRRVLALRDLGKLREHLGDLVKDVLVKARVRGDRPGGAGVEGRRRVDVALDQGLGVLLGDRLDVHPALGGDHRQQLLLGAVENHRRVVLGGDVGPGLDPDLVDLERPLAARAADVHAEDRLGMLARLIGVGGDLDPAGLAAAADQHLGLDRTGEADPLGGGYGGLDCRGDLAARHGYAVLGEELLSLILEEVHSRRRRRGAGGSL